MNVILSIKPEFVEKIFSGEKQYEYRKILFKQKVDTIYIYASRPVSKIVGEFKIDDIVYQLYNLSKDEISIIEKED